jgi:hypothetical protein
MLRSLRRAAAATVAVVAAAVGLAALSTDPPSPPQPSAPVLSLQPLQFVVQAVGWEPEPGDVVQPVESDDPNLSPGQDADIADTDFLVPLGGFQDATDEGVGLEVAGEALDVVGFVPLLAPSPRGGRSPPRVW